MIKLKDIYTEILNQRSNMPQINGDDIDVAIDRIRRKGIKVTRGVLPANEMKSSQKDHKREKVLNIAEDYGALESLDEIQPLILSMENHVIDGHHRRAALQYMEQADVPVPVIWIGLEQQEAIKAWKSVEE